MSPLHHACKLGYSEIVRFLLSLPHINVNLQDNKGWSPLFHAAFEGHKVNKKKKKIHKKFFFFLFYF
jgi:ankyrin repeat protein